MNPGLLAAHAKRLAVANGINASLIGTRDHALAHVDYYDGSGAEKTTAQANLDRWGHKRI